MTAPRRRSATDGYDVGVLPPHPLVCGLAVGMPGGNVAAANASCGLLASNRPAASSECESEACDAAGGPERLFQPSRPRVVVFAGYLGPPQTDPYPDDKGYGTWRLLYQDSKAMSWLMVPEGAIVLHDRARDDKAAFRLRDYIWVRADAPVRQGTEDESEQARFLVGTFTSAGDLHVR